jgi:acetyl esterase/lipase
MRRMTLGGLLVLLLLVEPSRAQEAALPAATDGRVEKDIAYLPPDSPEAKDEYAAAQCKLDLYLPEKIPDVGCPVVVWFHGGGLTGGSKAKGKSGLARRFLAHGIAMADVEYRFSPKVKYPVYLEDSAKAVAWVVTNAQAKGINLKAIFVSGHSAGGYIASMLAMDERLLKGAGVPAGAVAGYMPVSGTLVTHFTVREERGIPKERIVVDEAAPIYHCRKDAPPILLFAGDHDMAARVEEAKLFGVVMTDVAGSQTTQVVIVPDRTHSSIDQKLLTEGDPAGEAMLAFIKQWTVKN